MLLRRTAAACLLAAGLVVPTGATGAATQVEAEPRVLVISVDGLNPGALKKLGEAGAPHLHRLIDEGAFTLNARSQVEMTVTLPNHTSMVTGRRIDRRHRGHGVTWNKHRPGTTVQKAAGHPVGSIFSVLQKAGLDSALFAAKTKFSLFDRSWPGIDRVTIRNERDHALVKAVRTDLVDHHRALTFLHLGGVDKAGHAHGFMSPAYLDAVQTVDRRVGAILRTIDNKGLDDLTIVLTADHGGKGANHGNPKSLANFRVPFIVWGPDVVHANLYQLNPDDYADPGKRRVGFKGTQPIRNGDVANFVASLLGLGPVPDSLWGADQTLTAR